MMKDVTADKLQKETKVQQDALEILITAMVCLIFAKKFADQQVSWNLVVKKALAWVKKESEKLKLNTEWNTIGGAFLSSHLK